MKIGILYICTGKYSIFWEDFYRSCEKYFLNNHEKEYFVFTDASTIFGEEKTNVNKIYQENLGWPDNTLMRFSMFYSIKDRLINTDYLYFFNANLLFIKDIQDDFLPKSENLSVVIHPGYRNNKPNEFPYDRNDKCLAYIPYDSGDIYVQGALNGGKTIPYLEMVETLHYNVLKDKENGIVALWHDESHLNQYIIGRKDLKILGPEYVNQEGKNYEKEPMILSRNKDHYMNINDLRGIDTDPLTKLKTRVKWIIKRMIGRV